MKKTAIQIVKEILDRETYELFTYESDCGILDDDTPDFECNDKEAREMVGKIDILKEVLERLKQNEKQRNSK